MNTQISNSQISNWTTYREAIILVLTYSAIFVVCSDSKQLYFFVLEIELNCPRKTELKEDSFLFKGHRHFYMIDNL